MGGNISLTNSVREGLMRLKANVDGYVALLMFDGIICNKKYSG
jgi:hypothetical protein